MLCPSRELAEQTYEVLEQLCEGLAGGRYPRLRTLLAIGGIDLRDQMGMLNRGFHLCVATVGRLQVCTVVSAIWLKSD